VTFDGERIETYREQTQLSVQDLADRCGVSRTTLWRWVVGTTEPRATQLMLLAVALNKRPAQFFYSG
jgi:transcriptional regulator with XRE-family HTH domain